MATPPLPDVPCVRVRLIYNQGNPGEGGNRLYLSYSGSAPTGANCTTLATDIGAAWGLHIAPVVSATYELTEVDVLDIATNSGLSGQAHPDVGGDITDPELPDNCASNCEFNIARRYRGGKPRMYLPPPSTSQLANQSTYTALHVSNVGVQVAAFFAEIEALSIGAMGTLQHVNLSYYSGYTNVEVPGRRAKVIPNYRPLALHDNVVGYSPKAVIGSQRRRRSSTTP